MGFHVGRWGLLLGAGMGVVLEGVVGKVVLENVVSALEGPVTFDLVDFHVVRWQGW